MMPEGLLGSYRAAYNSAHTPVFRVEVWNQTEQLAVLPELISGDVKCSLTSQVTRRGTLVVPASLMPRDEGDLLAPFGNRLRIYRGIRAGTREFMFRVFTGLIVDADRKPRQPCTIAFADRAIEVDENDFEHAEQAITSHTIVEEIVRLIREGVPDAEFGRHDVLGSRVASQVFDDSRSNACDQLGEAGGAFWYALAEGQFVVRRVPWTFQPDGADVEPVVVYSERGDYYGTSFGTITDYGASMSRSNVFNVVVGVADQPNGSEPTRATVRDTNPASPTYVGGKFGRRVLRAELPSAATNAVVRHGAETVRRRSRSSAEALPWEMVPDPALELGDVAQVEFDGRRRLRVIADFNVPLVESGVMSVVGRPIVLPDGTLVDDVTPF